MARQGIGTGSSPNDGTGDTLRAGAAKVNDNFSEIYNYLGDGSNLNAVIGSGIATAGGTVGTGATILDFRGTGISTVTVSSGIATINITGGGGGSSYSDSDVDTHLNTSSASASEVLSWTGSDYDWVAQSAGITTANINADTLNVTGVSTLGVTSITNLTLQQLNATGLSTFNNNVTVDGGDITFTSQGDKLIFTSAAANPASGGAIEISTSGSGTAEISGNSNQLKIYNDQDANHSIDMRAGTYSWRDESADYYALFNSGSCKLYNPATAGGILDQKFETTGSGVIITGVCTATSFSGDGSALSGVTTTRSRTVVSGTTGSVGAAATTDLDITGFKSYGLLKVGISSAAWVRLYVDGASRTSDATRSYLVDPTPGSGLIAEVRTETAGISTFLMTPGIIGWNNDVSVGSTIYAAVTNNESSSATITVDLTVVKMED